MNLPKKALEGQESEDLGSKKNKWASSRERLPKKGEDLNNSNDSKKDMPRIFGAGRGILGLSTKLQRNIKEGLGLGFVIIGLYLLFIVFGWFSFTPKFEFLEDKLNLFLISMVLIILGVFMNGKLKNILKR